MQKDFHYYATCCAAYLAGYTLEEALDIAWSAQFVDLCSRTFLTRIHGPLSAATTQLQLELMDARTDLIGLQDITRIWSSFHFLPYDLTATPPFKCGSHYRRKYQLICRPNGALLQETVERAARQGLQAAGLAMHILADTWAHQNFAGTPSFAINNTNEYFYEILPDGSERQIAFLHRPSAVDDPVQGKYVGSAWQPAENVIMNLGHGRAGHLPDYSYARYRYLPAWGQYEEIIKDNPSDYYHAFTQMILALKFLRDRASATGRKTAADGAIPATAAASGGVAAPIAGTEPGSGASAELQNRSQEKFPLNAYDTAAVAPYEETLQVILRKRQIDACANWRAFGEQICGGEISDFNLEQHTEEYVQAGKERKSDTFLGKFFRASMAQKSLVTNRIYQSGSMLAGFSVDYKKKGFRGIWDFRDLLGRQTDKS